MLSLVVTLPWAGMGTPARSEGGVCQRLDLKHRDTHAHWQLLDLDMMQRWMGEFKRLHPAKSKEEFAHTALHGTPAFFLSSLSVSDCLSISLFVIVSVRFFSVRLSCSLSVCLSACLPVSLSVC